MSCNFVTAYESYYESLKKEFPKVDVGCFIRKPIGIDDLVKRIKTELLGLRISYRDEYGNILFL
jgi:hypothetical protein